MMIFAFDSTWLLIGKRTALLDHNSYINTLPSPTLAFILNNERKICHISKDGTDFLSQQAAIRGVPLNGLLTNIREL
jgi:hypothetical protein